MNTTEVLLKQHSRLKKELQEIAEDFFQDELAQNIRKFVFEYQDHEELEEALLKKLILTRIRSEEIRILRSYIGIHAGANVLLKELQNFIETGNVFYIQRAFYNFYLITLSHFDYEENTIYPLIDRILSDETVGSAVNGREAELKDDENTIKFAGGGNRMYERYSRFSHF